MSDAPSVGELLVRLVFSLGLIVGLLVMIGRFAKKSNGSLRFPGMRGKTSTIRVIDRQTLSKTASLAVVQIGERTMVVGITEHGVSLLAEGPELADVPPEEVTVSEDRSSRTSLPAAIAAAFTVTPREAKWTAPLGTNLAATTAAADSGHSPRMSFIEALRERTVRKT